MSERFVLYVHTDRLRASQYTSGCQCCIDIVSRMAVNTVLIQDTDILLNKGVALPDWIDGVPTLVDKQENTITKGVMAVKALQTMSLSYPVEQVNVVAAATGVNSAFELSHDEVEVEESTSKVTATDINTLLEKRRAQDDARARTTS